MPGEVTKKSDNVTFTLVQQVPILLLTSMILDGGMLFAVTGYAAAAYWVGFGIITARRRGHLTLVDTMLLRWGFLILCLVSPFLTGVIWHFRDN